MKRKKTYPNRGATAHVRAPSVEVREQWTAAAAAEGRSLSNWAAAILTAKSLPLKKDRRVA